MNYIFIFRCLVPDCDSPGEQSTTSYLPDWLNQTVPFQGDFPSKCLRYEKYNLTNHKCDGFNKSLSIECDKFVFEPNGEVTIVSAVSETSHQHNIF